MINKILNSAIAFFISLNLFSQTDLLIEGQTINMNTVHPQSINRTTPTNLIYRYNRINININDGYPIEAGTDDYSATYSTNLDGAQIYGNKVIPGSLSGTSNVHGIMAGYNRNYDIHHNYIFSYGYGIVHEGGFPNHTMMESSSGGIYYNILKNCTYFIVEKGYNGTKIYNNTFYSNLNVWSWFILVEESNTGGLTPPLPKAENIKIKNNIFVYEGTSTFAAIAVAPGCGVGFECDYNIYWFPNYLRNEPLFEYDNELLTWTQWRALGFDTHSVIMNPNFIDKNEFVPASRINHGTAIAGYNVGLAAENTTWTVGSMPATNVQGASWQPGARIYESPVIHHASYYVATNGNDNNPGTYAQPWATWGKAFTSNLVKAGDTVYIRGGVYNITVTNGDGYSVTRAGTSNNWIVYANYPGEVPILDCSAATTITNYNSGVDISTSSGANYIKFKGLTVRNVLQKRKDAMVFASGFGCKNGFFLFENCTAYNIEGIGFESYFYNGYSHVNGNHTFINCDAYNCSNPEVIPGYLPGNHGAGFSSQNWYGNEGHAYVINCRAWECGDQGYSWNGEHYCETNGCWAFNNGKLQGDGHGFKLGWHDNPYPSAGRLNLVLKKSIAAYNRASGITTNDLGEGIATGMNIYNNLMYYNGYMGGGFNYTYGVYVYNTPDSDANELLRIFRNNISYANEAGEIYVGSGAQYTHSNNSWDSGATITSADFKSLPASKEAGIAILSAPRKPDGSLPDLGDYFQLSSTSDAIDAGIDVGLPYKGLAPDLGPFEYDPGAQQSSAKNIISFTLPQQTGVTTINTGNYTVSIEVAHGTNITSLAPTISVSAGATINPASGVSRNFTNPVTYTVTAEDASTQTWIVTVTVEEEEPEPGEGKWVPAVKDGEFVIRNGRFVVKYVE